MPEFLIGLTGDQQRELVKKLRSTPAYGDELVRGFRITATEVHAAMPQPLGFVGPFGEGRDA